MKRSPLYPLRRFFSILILDKDIIEDTTEDVPHRAIHPLFLQEPEMVMPKKDWEERNTISIQPQEI